MKNVSASCANRVNNKFPLGFKLNTQSVLVHSAEYFYRDVVYSGVLVVFKRTLHGDDGKQYCKVFSNTCNYLFSELWWF